jgi:hypothetical protein
MHSNRHQVQVLRNIRPCHITSTIGNARLEKWNDLEYRAIIARQQHRRAQDLLGEILGRWYKSKGWREFEHKRLQISTILRPMIETARLRVLAARAIAKISTDLDLVLLWMVPLFLLAVGERA